MVRLFYSEDALDRGLYEQLRSQAVVRYGEPAVESTRTGINQFSDWDIGERTVLHLSLTESDIVIDYRGQLSRK